MKLLQDFFDLMTMYFHFWIWFFGTQREEKPEIDPEVEREMMEIREKLWDYYGKSKEEMNDLREQLRKLREENE